MATVISTRCTYAPTGGLPELTGASPVEIPDELLPLALSFWGVQEVGSTPNPDIPVPAAVIDPELPVTSWQSQTPIEPSA